MTERELSWRIWLDHGDKYLKAAIPKGKIGILGPTIRYNLLSISMENYIMAILDFYKTLPDNHTYTDLITSLEQVVPVDEGLKSRILKHECVQSICSMSDYHRNDPSEDDLVDLTGAITEIGQMAHRICA